MAEPIKITLLGDISDLAASMARASSEVDELGKELSGALEDAAKDAGRLGDEVSDGLDDATGEVDGFAKKIGLAALAVGAAVGGALVMGLKEAMDQEAGNDLLAAQIGADPAEAKRLGQAAGQVYSAGYGESIADANEALKSLWQQGLVPAGATSDQLAEISKKAMDVATVLGEEVGPTSNAVGQMLKTGLAKDADEAFDILVRGSQLGANKAEDLLDTFNEYGVQFKGLGLDGKTAMGLLSQGLQAGARDADLVADSMKEFGLIVRAGGDQVNEAYGKIGLSGEAMTAAIAQGGPAAAKALDQTLDGLRGIKDPAERSAIAVALFGTQAEDLQSSLFALDPSSAVASLGKVDGAAKSAGDTLHDNAQAKLTAFWRALETGAVNIIGGKVLPKLEALAHTLAPFAAVAKDVILNVAVPALRTLAETLGATFRFIEDHKGVFAGIATVIGVVLLPMLVQWGITSTVQAAAAVTAWVTSATASTTSAVTQVAASWAMVGGWLRMAGQAVISGAVVVGQWVAGAAAAIANGAVMVGTWVLMGTQALLQAARMALAWIIAMGPIAIVIAAVVALALLIYNNWDTIKQYTVAAFMWVWETVKKVFAFLLDLFLNWTGPGLLIKHWDTIKTKTAEAFLWVRDKAREGLDAVVGFFRDLPGRILGFLGSAGSAAAGVGRSIIDGLGRGLAQLASFGASIGDAVARGLKNSINYLIDLLNYAIPNRIGIGPVGVDIPANPIPKIRAMGGAASGWTRVGERGPEEVFLPKGSTVVPNHASARQGGVVVNVQSTADPYAIGRQVAWALRTSPV